MEELPIAVEISHQKIVIEAETVEPVAHQIIVSYSSEPFVLHCCCFILCSGLFLYIVSMCLKFVH